MSAGSSPLLTIRSSDSDADFVPPTQRRRSARAIKANSKWANSTAADIAAVLAQSGIPFNAELSKEDLVLLTHNTLGSPQLHAEPNVPGPAPDLPVDPAADLEEPAPPPKKRRAKTKHLTPAPRKRKPTAPTLPDSPVSSQPILDAVLSLTASITAIDSRIQALEHQRPALPASSPSAAPPAPAAIQWPVPLQAPNTSTGVYPDRRIELDTYLAIMADFNLRYGGTLFYQYHNAFSAKSASYISLYNLRLDWSVVDTELLVRHFSGQRSLSCNICGSHAHTAILCPQTAFNRPPLPVAVQHPDSGFRVGVLSPLSCSYTARNLQSALTEPSIVSELLSKELNKGYVLGPFSAPPFHPFRVNSLGVATRKYSGKKRLIFDMSSPHSETWSSVNEMIPLEPFSLHYASVDNAIHLIKIAGQGALLAKADITDAFKVMPIHPADWPLFCVKWQSKFYFAVRLTFGCRSSPHIFNCLSEALCWILLNVCHLPFVLHLLDDFLLIDFPAKTSSVLDVLRNVFQELGVPLSAEKTLGPVTSLEFLGIILDSVKMQASLPDEKLTRIREVSASSLSVGSVTKRELLSLLGHLNFAMRIIPQGRSFISRLLDLAHSVENLSDSIVLDSGCQSDLSFWSKLLKHWNGISFFYNDHTDSSVSLKLFTDAAPSLGFGGLYNDLWFAEKWSDEFLAFSSDAVSSALFELYPIVVSCVLWGKEWSRKRILFFCDNEAVVAIINKGRSRCPKIMSLLRRLTWQSVIHNFVVNASHVPGYINVEADALSRLRFQEFQRLCPSASKVSTPCPKFSELLLV
ncbi:uncharacterized protein LOC134071030 [Sardina pilchardus]|uniref:uncharacterized protein LOC134071030 n=1 Tax=Sardina pilchardus TaxID=27697 RepID=UPI002E136099